MTQRIGTRSHVFPQTLLGRMAASVLAAALVVAAFFFLFFVLLVGGVAIVAISLRLLWRAKKIRPQATQDVLEGEYSVVRQEEVADTRNTR